jgi:bacteriocin-like protein
MPYVDQCDTIRTLTEAMTYVDQCGTIRTLTEEELAVVSGGAAPKPDESKG